MYVPFHVEFLKDELVRRQSKNPKYSLRAFAHQLEIHPSALSRILAMKQALSLKSAVIVTEVLKISEDEKRSFLVSVAEEQMHRAAAFFASTCGVVVPIARDKVDIEVEPGTMVAMASKKKI